MATKAQPANNAPAAAAADADAEDNDDDLNLCSWVGAAAAAAELLCLPLLITINALRFSCCDVYRTASGLKGAILLACESGGAATAAAGDSGHASPMAALKNEVILMRLLLSFVC